MIELLRASTYYRDSHCFANRRMAQEAEKMGVLPPESTEFTERGKRVHAGKPQDKDESEAWQYVLKKSYAVFDKYANGREYKVESEQELLLRDGFIPYFSGHPDRFIVLPDMVVWVEFKPGFEEDWEMWRWQNDGYAALFSENFPVPNFVCAVITRFHGIREYQYNQVTDNYRTEIKQVAKFYAAESKTQPLAGPWCKYCRARLICKEAINYGLKVASASYPVEKLPGGEEGAAIVEKLKLMMKLAKDRLEWYRDRIKTDSDFLAGRWKLKNRKTPHITDTLQTMDRLYDLNLLSKREVVNCADISVPKLRDALTSRHKDMSEEKATRVLVDALGELMQFQESDFWLVKGSDPELPQ